MERRKRVTIYDIARITGVTTATVSRVINGKHGISKETRERVIAAMRKERYFPSPAASGLRKKSTREIGILSPFFIGDFFLKIFESLHRQLKDFDLILYNAQTPAHRREVIDRIVAEEKLCALIVASTPILLEEELLVSSLGVPVVMVEARHPAYSSVDYDHQIGAFKAVSHLIEMGHRELAIIGGKPETRLYSPIGKERLKGYRKRQRADAAHPEDAAHRNLRHLRRTGGRGPDGGPGPGGKGSPGALRCRVRQHSICRVSLPDHNVAAPRPACPQRGQPSAGRASHRRPHR
jgi:LacI family transcriptional regulator